jgi:hypothetical protein
MMKQNRLHFVSIRQSIKTDIIYLLVITAIWIIMVILVNPIGDFPLNDDWAYGRTVKSVVETGDFQLTGWTAANLFSQVVWGALFSFPFGFSFTALRFSTLTLGLIGVLATYGLLKETNLNQQVSLLGALLVTINPIYFGLSNTFMNDVPFFGFATVSVYFFLRGLKGSTFAIVTGTLIACIAILTRQSGLAIPLAFGCAYLMKKGVNLPNLIKGFFPALLGLGIQISYQQWLQLTMRSPDKYGNQVRTLLHELASGLEHSLSNLTTVTLFSLIYLGLFILPFSIIPVSEKLKEFPLRRQTLILLYSSTFLIVVMKLLVSTYGLMPLHGNILGDLGIGPVILKNGELPKAPHFIWLIITVAGVVGGVLFLLYLFFTIVQIFKRNSGSKLVEKDWLTIFILALVCIYFLPIGFLGLGPFGFYDRYLIFLLPLLMMIVSVSPVNIHHWKVSYRTLAIALIMMFAYGGFTVAATHDYLSWNRVRWQALHHLMQEDQISPSHIDGGFEFNGWYLYDDDYDDWKYEPDKSWYWVDNDDYVVSFNPLTGYEEVKRYTFKRWLPWGQGNILVLRKTTASLR